MLLVLVLLLTIKPDPAVMDLGVLRGLLLALQITNTVDFCSVVYLDKTCADWGNPVCNGV